MKIQSHPTAAAFRNAAFPFLLREEARYCLPIGLVDTFEKTPERYPSFQLLTIERDSTVVGVAWHTPPQPIGLTSMPLEAVDLVVRHFAPVGPEARGVFAPPEIAQRFVDLWGSLTGATTTSSQGMHVFQIDRVIPPAPVAGHMRLATATDRQLLEDWDYCFLQNCHLEGGREEASASVERALKQRSRFIWEVNGAPSSMAGFVGTTPHGIRIAAVYTPPPLRGRGYASAIVADLSQKMLNAGRRFCFLFTDLANPVSNKIYQRLGYKPVGDWTKQFFE